MNVRSKRIVLLLLPSSGAMRVVPSPSKTEHPQWCYAYPASGRTQSPARAMRSYFSAGALESGHSDNVVVRLAIAASCAVDDAMETAWEAFDGTQPQSTARRRMRDADVVTDEEADGQGLDESDKLSYCEKPGNTGKHPVTCQDGPTPLGLGLSQMGRTKGPRPLSTSAEKVQRTIARTTILAKRKPHSADSGV
jgi:hypothetical protein